MSIVRTKERSLTTLHLNEVLVLVASNLQVKNFDKFEYFAQGYDNLHYN